MRDWVLQELNYAAVKQRQYEVAVLPVGAAEPHNLHLPYGQDAFHATEVANQACEYAHHKGARVVLLPTLPFGTNSNMMAFPLTVNVRPSTLNVLVSDVIASMAEHGVLKFVIFNGHGGNTFKPLLRELYGQTRAFVCLIDWWTVGADVQGEIFQHRGDHADEMETSLAQAFWPELVDVSVADEGRARPSRFEAINRGWVKISRPWHLLTTNSGVGDPRAATADKARRYLDVVVPRIGQFLLELSKAEMDERFPY